MTRAIVASLFVVALACFGGCPHPGPAPVPPAPATSVACDGGAGFDGLVNSMIVAAGIDDDATSFAALDKIAADPTVSRAVAVCVARQIIPDLRAAPVTSVHLQAWVAQQS